MGLLRNRVQVQERWTRFGKLGPLENVWYLNNFSHHPLKLHFSFLDNSFTLKPVKTKTKTKTFSIVTYSDIAM